MPSHRPRGFTLIELLVVISIIALLIAMLLPALSGARKSARSLVCQAQLRQIAISSNLYAADWDNYLPNHYGATGAPSDDYGYTGMYAHRLARYMTVSQNNLICPDYSDYPARNLLDGLYSYFGFNDTFQSDSRFRGSNFTGEANIRMSYGLVQDGAHKVDRNNLTAYPVPNLDRMHVQYWPTSNFPRNPSEFAVVVEVRNPLTYAVASSLSNAAWNVARFNAFRDCVKNSDGTNAPFTQTLGMRAFSIVHNRATNVPFADGHVRLYSFDELFGVDITAPGINRGTAFPF